MPIFPTLIDRLYAGANSDAPGNALFKEAADAISEGNAERLRLVRGLADRVVEEHASREYAENLTAAAAALVAECDRRAIEMKEGKRHTMMLPWLDLQVVRDILATKSSHEIGRLQGADEKGRFDSGSLGEVVVRRESGSTPLLGTRPFTRRCANTRTTPMTIPTSTREQVEAMREQPMSDTPRTDAFMEGVPIGQHPLDQYAALQGFARTLERELCALNSVRSPCPNCCWPNVDRPVVEAMKNREEPK